MHSQVNKEITKHQLQLWLPKAVDGDCDINVSIVEKFCNSILQAEVVCHKHPNYVVW